MFTWLQSLTVRLCNTKLFNRSLVGFMTSSLSKKFIPTFIRHYHINESEIAEGQTFNSLHDFFIRDISMDKRPMGDGRFISPCDGVIVDAGKIEPNKTFIVKSKRVDVKYLLGKEIQADSFQVIYLSPANYHQFHAIDDNSLIDFYFLGGKSIPVNDMGYKLGNPFLENRRAVLETEDYYYIPVGAVNVNAINITSTEFKKGDKVGYFAFGSTIVILYKNDPGKLKTGKIKVRENLTC